MQEWDEVLEFWFPEGPNVDPETHSKNWMWRMRGGADDEIVRRFTDITLRGARGELDHWAAEPNGRLALIIVLDQFPRSVFRNSPQAFAQDPKALKLALEGYENGHYAALEHVWHKTVFNLPLGHCEGPDHLERLDLAIRLGREILDEAPDRLKHGYAFSAEQPVEVRKVIEAFGRHPHRNEALGRASTPDEEAYIAAGAFPHLRMPTAANEAGAAREARR